MTMVASDPVEAHSAMRCQPAYWEAGRPRTDEVLRSADPHPRLAE